MIRNIGFLFNGMGVFNCNKSLKLFDLWDEKKSDIKKGLRLLIVVWMYMTYFFLIL